MELFDNSQEEGDEALTTIFRSEVEEIYAYSLGRLANRAVQFNEMWQPQLWLNASKLPRWQAKLVDTYCYVLPFLPPSAEEGSRLSQMEELICQFLESLPLTVMQNDSSISKALLHVFWCPSIEVQKVAEDFEAVLQRSQLNLVETIIQTNEALFTAELNYCLKLCWEISGSIQLLDHFQPFLCTLFSRVSSFVGKSPVYEEERVIQSLWNLFAEIVRKVSSSWYLSFISQ